MNWICKNCETKNEAHQNCCYVCGALRDETNAINAADTSAKKPGTVAGARPIEVEMKDKSRNASEGLSPIILTILTVALFWMIFKGI